MRMSVCVCAYAHVCLLQYLYVNIRKPASHLHNVATKYYSKLPPDPMHNKMYKSIYLMFVAAIVIFVYYQFCFTFKFWIVTTPHLYDGNRLSSEVNNSNMY